MPHPPMLASNNTKPLPSVPLFPTLTELSTTSRHHLQRIIRQALSEDPLHISEDARYDWARVIEHALDDLGETCNHNSWLAGVKNRQKKKKHESSRTKDHSAPPSPSTDLHKKKVEEISALLSNPPAKEGGMHLLLCVEKLGGSSVLPAENGGHSTAHHGIACIFTPGAFPLSDLATDPSLAISGLQDWTEYDQPVRIIGGTFTLKGLTSLQQHHTICKTLRLAIYTRLSLILEQFLLSDSHVKVMFPEPRPLSPVVAHRLPKLGRASSPSSKRASFLPSGLLSIFSKGRSPGASPRGISLDLPPAFPTIPEGARTPDENSPRASPSGSPMGSPRTRFRRFSFLGDGSRPSFLKSPPLTPVQHPADAPFQSALERVKANLDLYSTCPSLHLTPPSLLVSLAEKEKKEPGRRLLGDERAALTSLNGWSSKDDKYTNLSGTHGLIRHQQISFLFCQHLTCSLPPSRPNSDPSASSVSSTTSVASTASKEAPRAGTSLCERPMLSSAQFYGERDQHLGDFIVETVERAQERCDDCQYTRRDHQRRYIHGGTKIVIDVPHSEAAETAPVKDDGSILMWLSCAICERTTEKRRMSDGAYMYSFAKLLELLAYSPALAEITPRLCDHTSPPHYPRLREDTPLPRSRVNIIRHFAYRGVNVDISVAVIDDVFEVRVPRLQIMKGAIGDKLKNPTGSECPTPVIGGAAVAPKSLSKEELLEEEKKGLKQEILTWFRGLNEHMDRLAGALSVDDLNSFWKTLPRLPTGEIVFDGEKQETPNSSPASSTTSSPVTPPVHQLKYVSPNPSISSLVGTPLVDSPQLSFLEPSRLLSNMRLSFEKTEASLLSQLDYATVFALNDVRRSFHTAARGISKRVSAWQKKHLGKSALGDIHVLKAKEPEWWKKGHHAIPGSSVIVREDDWGSIIAFTLGTIDYQKELNNLSGPRLTPAPLQSPSSPRTSYFPNTRFFSSGPEQLDPDQEGLVWHEPEAYTAAISRKEHPSHNNALAGLRGVLRQKALGDNPTGHGFIHTSGGKPFTLTLPPSRASSLNIATPPSAWAKPAVEVSTQAVSGEVTGLPDTKDVAEKILHDLELTRPVSNASSTSSQSDFFDARVRRAGSSSLTSLVDTPPTAGSELPPLPPIPPPKSSSLLSSPHSPQQTPVQTTPTQSGFASIAGSIVHAMRLALHNDTSHNNSPLGKNHHGLLTLESANIDERPHIKYEWTVGRKLKFSCTVYYAKQYDNLRKRCGIDDIYLKSMSRSKNWQANGGKSKSNFWKTTDDRFIIKTLVNGWGVADLQVLLDGSPFYFKYLDSTSTKPTVLAKCVGFYTVEIKNMETGAVQSKADLTVMENLFYDQKISKTFDLKGIQGRKVKAAQTTKTLFDGEWIEGQQKTLSLLHPHSKLVLCQALRTDSDFLAKANIMDYSLLVGVNEEKKELVCGLVDTIGSYTFGKTLEHKAKQGLHPKGKEVTVVPPRDYQERFVNSLERYFLPCPDKWCKPIDDNLIITEVEQLPSVL